MKWSSVVLVLSSTVWAQDADAGVDAGLPEFVHTVRHPLGQTVDEQRVQRVFASLSVRARAAQLLLAYPQIGRSTPVEVGGVVFVGNLLSNIPKAREKIASLYVRSTVPPFMAVDMEGGSSNRMKRYPGLRALPGARELGAMSDVEVRRWGRRVGEAMRDLGLSMNLAPVFDVAGQGHLFDSGRVFGNEPSLVGHKGKAYAEGLLAAGVVPIGKHFPGYGEAGGNSDHELIEDSRSVEALSTSMVAFDAAKAQLGGVMMANVQYTAFAKRPAIITESLVALAHQRGWVTVTDDIAIAVLADSISGSLVDVLREAVLAGNDLILTTAPPDWDKGIDPVGVLEKLSNEDPVARQKIEAACLRLLRLKDRMGLLVGF